MKQENIEDLSSQIDILEIPIRNWNPLNIFSAYSGLIDIRDTYKELKPKVLGVSLSTAYNIRDTYKELKHVYPSLVILSLPIILEIPIRNWN